MDRAQSGFQACRTHSLFTWSAQNAVDPLPVTRAEGVRFWTADGQCWLDMNSQLMTVNIGHAEPRVVQCIARQAATLTCLSPMFANAPRGLLARRLVERVGGRAGKVLFTNAGSDANEHAMRMARVATGRHKILAQYHSYHGGTAGSMALTGERRRWDAEPGMPGVVHFFGPWADGGPRPDPAADALEHLRRVMQCEGPHNIAAVVLETVGGSSGILIPPDGYLQGVRELCDEAGCLLILDEVAVGFGRTGRWFAFEHWGVEPDMVTLAKGLTAGYVPLGAVVVSDAVAQAFADRPLPSGLTYSGHPLACATAMAVLDVYEQDGLVQRSASEGNWLGERLSELATVHEAVGTVRSIGLCAVLELVTARQPYTPAHRTDAGRRRMARCLERIAAQQVYVFSRDSLIFLNPPLCIERSDLEAGLEAVRGGIEEFSR